MLNTTIITSFCS